MSTKWCPNRCISVNLSVECAIVINRKVHLKFQGYKYRYKLPSVAVMSFTNSKPSCLINTGKE